MSIICSIFKSLKQPGAYLYVEKSKDMSLVPDALLQRFGKPVHVMTLLLQEGRVLANVDVNNVLAAIAGQGFYLQLSASEDDDYMLEVHQKNCKY